MVAFDQFGERITRNAIIGTDIDEKERQMLRKDAGDKPDRSVTETSWQALIKRPSMPTKGREDICQPQANRPNGHHMPSWSPTERTRSITYFGSMGRGALRETMQQKWKLAHSYSLFENRLRS